MGLHCAAMEALHLQQRRAADARKMEEDKAKLEQRWLAAITQSAEIEEEAASEVTRLQEENSQLREKLHCMGDELSRVKQQLTAVLQLLGPIAGAAAADGELPPACDGDYADRAA